MVFPIAGGTQDTGYEISNSLRFNDGDSANLSRSISSSGSNTNASISFWLKRGTAFGSQQILFTNVKTDYYFRVALDSSARLEIIDVTNGSVSGKRVTNRLFRDPSAFYHIFIGVDGGQGTEENRVKVYINGVAETSWSSETAWQSTFQMNADDLTHYVGQRGDSNQYFDGYMSEFNYVDGTTKAYTDFGEFNDNGVWIPKKYTGSYGTNGFFLEFQQTGTSQNSSGIGADTSGQDNHFAVSNLAATDVTVDTPTNNFCTGNPIAKYINDTNVTFSEGNVKGVAGAVATSYNFVGTFGSANMNFYFEAKATNVDQNNDTRIGVVPVDSTAGVAINGEHNQVVYRGDGSVVSTGETALNSQGNITDGMIVGVAVDPDNNVKWYLNGTLTSTQSINATYRGPIYIPYFRHINSATVEFNFGNPSFSISSGNADANGYGNFEYSVPSGYYALCTKNLAEYG